MIRLYIPYIIYIYFTYIKYIYNIIVYRVRIYTPDTKIVVFSF